MPKFKGIDGSGKMISLIQEEGYYFPEKMVEMTMQNDMKKKLHNVRNFKARDDDILLCAYMKSGMHWLWEIVSMLVNKTPEYSKYIKEAVMLEANTQEELDALPSPRVLNLHFPLKFVPLDAIRKKRPILHIMRNPKDVCVSYFNHYQALPAYENVDSFSAFLPMFTGENDFYLEIPWHEYELEWERFSKDNPDYPILNLYYEDLHQDMTGNIEKLADFLKISVTDELIKNIADNCHIDKMRQATTEIKQDIFKDFLVNGKPVMYRKGQVGDWKNWFTVAENEMFDTWLDKHLVNTELTFKYSF